jgi:sugar phosphate isomerase/epimerase
MAKVTAISTLGWSKYTIQEAFTAMAARGFRRIEIASFGEYCWHFNETPSPEELKALLDKYQFTPVNLNFCTVVYDASSSDGAGRFLADWTAKLPALEKAGIPMMCMHFGARNQRDDVEHQLDVIATAFDELARRGKDYGVKLVIEAPHLYQLYCRPETVLKVVDKMSSDNFGVLVDASHWGIIGYDIDEYFARLGKRLAHIQLRDSTGEDTADRRQMLELTPGDGIVDFRKFGDALDRAGYTGDVSLEFEYRDVSLEDIEHEFDKGISWLRKCGWEFPEGVLPSV